MFPGIYGFTWSTGYLIFLGIFYSVVVVIVSTVVLALRRAFKDFRERKYEALLWKADFEDLPESMRNCRHELTGEYKHRVCHRAFDCRECEEHARLLAIQERGGQTSPVLPGEEARLFGLNLPMDRFYHRGHTWVKPQTDGTWVVGLDDFAQRLIGQPDAAELPAVGKEMTVNGPGWYLRKGKTRIRILSPTEGRVVATGGPQQEWFLKVKSERQKPDVRHLLTGQEVPAWMLREMERLQYGLASDGVSVNLADGGELVKNLPEGYPQADWDAVWGDAFLEP